MYQREMSLWAGVPVDGDLGERAEGQGEVLMMENENALVCFQYEGQPVRTVTGEDGEPRFVAADVCAVLELADGRTSVNQLDDDERHSMPVIDSREARGGLVC